MNKKAFIFASIGFGCGMIISGLLGVVLILSTNEYKNSILEGKPQVEQAKEEQTSSEVLQDLFPKDETISLNETKAIEETEENQYAENRSEEKIEILIPAGSTASETCEILEKNGLIEDAKDFNEFIRTQRKTTFLQEGTLCLSKNATYEVLLEELLTK